MKLTFANGTSRQQTQWRQAIQHLLSLPMDSMPLSIEVSFVEPSEVTGHGHTDLAATTWEYDSTSSTTKVRNDAPGYDGQRKTLEALAASMGLKYNADIHYNETAAHELGHSLFAALPQEARIAIAALFGAKSDDISELSPDSQPWEDRIIEGIAETFKEAFLPRRHRVFPNRTQKRIPYSAFPEFRRLFRAAIPEVEVSEELGEGEEEVPGLSSLDIFAQGEPFAPPAKGVLNYLAGSLGRHGIWSTSFANIAGDVPEAHDSFAFDASLFEGWLKDGTVLSYEFTVTADLFTPPYFAPKSFLSQYHDSVISWLLIKKKAPGGVEEVLVNPAWDKTVMSPEIVEAFGGEPVGEYGLYDAAKGGGAPPVTFKGSVTVNAANFSKTRKCKGVTYRFVTLIAQTSVTLTEQFPETVAEHERLREFYLYRWNPTLVITQLACNGGTGERGQEIDVPPGIVVPGSFRVGSHPSRRPVVGR